MTHVRSCTGVVFSQARVCDSLANGRPDLAEFSSAAHSRDPRFIQATLTGAGAAAGAAPTSALDRAVAGPEVAAMATGKVRRLAARPELPRLARA
jgi:hypothetical protein